MKQKNFYIKKADTLDLSVVDDPVLLSLEIPFVTISLSFVKKPIKMKFHDNEKFS